MDFADPAWWVRVIWLVGLAGLIFGGAKASRVLLARAGRDVLPPHVERFLAVSDGVAALGMIVVTALIVVRFVFL